MCVSVKERDSACNKRYLDRETECVCLCVCVRDRERVSSDLNVCGYKFGTAYGYICTNSAKIHRKPINIVNVSLYFD